MAGDDRRSAAVALFENLKEVATRGGLLADRISKMSNCTLQSALNAAERCRRGRA